MPVLSIIIPVYNVEDYVAECLHSIVDANVDTSQYEVIIVNDGTKDRSMDIIHDIVDGRENIRVIDQENMGLSAARMTGLSDAGGEYVWFIDSDDWLELEGLATVLSLITGGNNEDVYAFPLHWSFPDPKDDYVDFRQKIAIEGTGREMLKHDMIPVWASQRFIVRHSLFREHALYFPKSLLHEDEYFNRVLLYIASSVRIMPCPVYNYRQRSNSITTSKSVKAAYHVVAIYEHLLRFANIIVSESDRKWFCSQIVSFLLTSYTKCRQLVGTEEFDDFKKGHANFIWQQYRQYVSYTPIEYLKTRTMLFHPAFYFWVKQRVTHT